MISVIIPAYNEGEHILRCIENIQREQGDIEIIVTDGGSVDGTLELAGQKSGVRMVQSAKGRGIQMNTGAHMSTGELLLFLHADTMLEERWKPAMLSALEDPAVAGGAFTFSIDGPDRKYRAVEQWVKLRCLFCKLPYGDQGIFVRRHIFERLSGYKNIPLMEDVDLIARMKQLGKIVILDTRAVTSARRWAGKGLIRTAVLNQVIMLSYRMGVSPHTLAKIYYR